MRAFFLSAFFCCALFSSAQPTLSWSGKLYAEDMAAVQFIGVYGNEAFLTLRNSQTGVLLDAYDVNTFARTSRTQLAPGDSARPLRVERVFLLKGKPLVVASGYEASGKRRLLYACAPGKADLPLMELPYPSRKNGAVSLQYVLSPDSSRLLVARITDKIRDERREIRFTAIDTALKVLSEGEEDLPLAKVFEKYSGAQLTICNNGNVCLLKTESVRGFMREKSAQQTLISYKGAIRNELPVRMISGEHLSKLSLCSDAKSNVLITGFSLTLATKGINHNQLDGVFYMRLGPDLEVRNWGSVQDIPPPEHTRVSTDQHYAEPYLPRLLHVTPDGGLTAVYEKYWEKPSDYENVNPRDSSEREHVHELKRMMYDLAVLRFDSSGKLSWFRFVPKKQHATAGRVDAYSEICFFGIGINVGGSDRYGDADIRHLSFGWQPANAAVTLFFNDPADFDSRPPSRVEPYSTAHVNKAALQLARIDEKGMLTTEPVIHSQSDGPYLPCPAESYSCGNGRMLLLGTYWGSVHLGRLETKPVEK